jgi:4,5-dihydroxyphthalate decarboxylase
MRWIVGTDDVFRNYDQKTSIEMGLDLKKTATDWLLDGDIDVLLTDISDGKQFDILERDPRVKRLFPNYMEEDERLYRETGIYTPVHMIIMSKRLDRQHPDLAGKLYAAFERSKQIATNDVLADQRGFGIVYLRERKLEEMKEWGDPWKQGITANKGAIDTFIQYNGEQGMIRSAPSYEQIFAASTLDT